MVYPKPMSMFTFICFLDDNHLIEAYLKKLSRSRKIIQWAKTSELPSMRKDLFKIRFVLLDKIHIPISCRWMMIFSIKIGTMTRIGVYQY
jgi:hypothetical protein